MIGELDVRLALAYQHLASSKQRASVDDIRAGRERRDRRDAEVQAQQDRDNAHE